MFSPGSLIRISLAFLIACCSATAFAQCALNPASPSVTICEPANGATGSSPVHIVAGTTSASSVNLMQVYVDGVKSYEVLASTLDASVPMATGARRVTVQAKNSAGTIFKSTINITVSGTSTGPCPLNPTAPSVTICEPVDGATVDSPVHIVAGTTSNTAVTLMQIYVDSVKQYQVSASTLDTSLAMSAGTHRVTVQARDATAVIAKSTINITVNTGSPPPPPGTTSVLTYKYDRARTGANLKETTLTPANVKSSTFGKRFSLAVDTNTNIYAQPLYVSGLTIKGATRNVLFVATAHDSVYAFDADGTTLSPLWKKSFINAANGVTTIPRADVGGTIYSEIGIIGTPVIDESTQTLYVVAATKEGTSYFQRLHALSLIDGSEKFSGPVVIQASVPGTGDGVDANGNIPFQPKIQLQRPALLLLNGTVYIAWGSHGDNGPYHGWVMGFDAQTLTRVAVHNSSPNGRRAGIWQSGGGLAADDNGNLYYISGNGSFSGSSKNYGDSFVKLNQDGSVADYFTPFDQSNMNAHDIDLGVGGPLIIPDQPAARPHLITGCGKDAKIYLIDRDNMGKFRSTDNSNAVQTIPNGSLNHCHMQPVYWNGHVYFAGESSPMREFTLNNGVFNTTPTSQTSVVFTGGDNVGTNPVVSADGTSNGIVWSMQRDANANAILHAFDATDLAKELYNSNQVASRDALGAHQKYTPPVVVNGKVYVSLKGKISVFGLLP